MSASKEIKDKNLPSLAYVASKSNTSCNTLHNWYNNNYQRFVVVVEGVKIISDRESESNDNI